MLKVVHNPAQASIKMRLPGPSSIDFGLEVEEVLVPIMVSEASEQTVDSVVFDYTSESVSRIDFQLYVNPLADVPFKSVSFRSADESIATVDEDGYVTSQQDATGQIYVDVTGKRFRLSKHTKLRCRTETEGESYSFNRFTPGSLEAALCSGVDSLISGKDPNTAKRIFTSQDHVNKVFVRNSQCWAGGLDLSGISPSNSYSAHLRAGALVTRNAAILSRHYPTPNGTQFTFVDMDGTSFTVTQVDRRFIDYVGWETDVCVVLFDQELPPGIKHYKVLPADFQDYFSQPPQVPPPPIPGASQQRSWYYGIPMLALDQEEKALVTEGMYFFTGASSYTNINHVPSDETRLAFFESLIPGDSGNGGFLILGGELVFFMVWLGGGAGGGPCVSLLIDEINAALDDMAGGYHLETYDLSGYTKWG